MIFLGEYNLIILEILKNHFNIILLLLNLRF